jgi:hypothetical protein
VTLVIEINSSDEESLAKQRKKSDQYSQKPAPHPLLLLLPGGTPPAKNSSTGKCASHSPKLSGSVGKRCASSLQKKNRENFHTYLIEGVPNFHAREKLSFSFYHLRYIVKKIISLKIFDTKNNTRTSTHPSEG